MFCGYVYLFFLSLFKMFPGKNEETKKTKTSKQASRQAHKQID